MCSSRRVSRVFLTLGCFVLLAGVSAGASAQDTPEPQTITVVESEATEVLPTIEAGLKVTPPERAKIGRAWAQNAQRLSELDAWIEQTAVDAPQNLIMRDFLLAMPISVSGPRLVALAKKSKSEAIQASWKRYLSPYPGPYASVLASWTLAASDEPEHFLSLLREYAELQPAQALKLWTVLIQNNTIESLGRVAEYGLDMKGAVVELSSRLSADNLDEAQRLRIYRALTRTVDKQGFAGDLENRDTINRDTRSLIQHKAVSRRIVGLDIAGALDQRSFYIDASTRYKDAKNTTERAHALRAMLRLGEADHASALSAALTDALIHGDEVLRLEAASSLQKVPKIADNIPTQTIQSAFEAEIWPETQLHLYRVLSTRIADASFKLSVLKNAQLTLKTRQAAVEDLTQSAEAAASLTLDDMSELIRTGAPIDLIATSAEVLYTYHPEVREKLQTWISVQHPFERRLLVTFARFVQIDKTESAEVKPYVREICIHAPEEENILQPCMSYFEDHAQTDEDKALLNKLRGRQRQFDMMLDL